MSSNKERLEKALAQPCEKASICIWATEACRKPVTYNPDTDNAIPARRWMNCAGWPVTLKMHFDKVSGRWVYLSEETRKMLDKFKLSAEESYDEVVKRLIKNGM